MRTELPEEVCRVTWAGGCAEVCEVGAAQDWRRQRAQQVVAGLLLFVSCGLQRQEGPSRVCYLKTSSGKEGCPEG